MSKSAISLADLPPHIAKQVRRKLKESTCSSPAKPSKETSSASPRRRNQKLEDKLHKSIAQYLSLCAPDGLFWTSIENRQCGPIEGQQRKERGCKAGVPDIYCCWDSRSMWLEVKLPKAPRQSEGKQSKIQLLRAAEIVKAGGSVVVVRSIDDVQKALRKFGVPLSL